MCITRVGKVLHIEKNGAMVNFLDGATSQNIDVTVAGAQEGSYVEVFGNLALSVLTPREARARKTVWQSIRKEMVKMAA